MTKTESSSIDAFLAGGENSQGFLVFGPPGGMGFFGDFSEIRIFRYFCEIRPRRGCVKCFLEKERPWAMFFQFFGKTVKKQRFPKVHNFHIYRLCLIFIYIAI